MVKFRSNEGAVMRIEVATHVPFEGPGFIEEWAAREGHELEVLPLYQGSELNKGGIPELLVVMGGPMGVSDEELYPWMRKEKAGIAEAIDGGSSVLGICLGAQLVASVLGARVTKNPEPEIGWFPVHNSSPPGSEPDILRGIPSDFVAFHWHSETFEIPRGAISLFKSDACPNQGFLLGKHVLGLQFHLEITPAGVDSLAENCAPEIRPAPYIQPREAIASHEHFSEAQSIMNTLLHNLTSIRTGV